MTALWAQGRRGFNGVTDPGTSRGRWRRGLGEDDGVAGLGISRVDGVVGSGMAWGA
jgi:hypothetical protein